MFKIGDRVRAIEEFCGVKTGDTGKVLETSIRPYVEWDKPIKSGHDAFGKGKDGYCHSIPERYLELIKEATMINTTARDSVAQALRDCKEAYAKRFDEAIGAIEKAEKPEEVMAAKKRLLSALVSRLPIRSETCYFCKIHFPENTNSCDSGKCEYAKHKGNCNALDSTRRRIQDTRNELLSALSTYYNGEAFTDPEREKRHAEFLRLKAEFDPQDS